MSFSRSKPGNWGVNEVLTSPQMNQIDSNLANALDKTVAGDTLSGRINCNGAGRIIPTVFNLLDATGNIVAGQGTTVIRVGSGITASRNLNLATIGAVTNDIITVYNDSSPYSVTVRNLFPVPTTLFVVGTGPTDDGSWASFIFMSGTWHLFQSSRGSTTRRQTFTSDGIWVCPRGVYRIELEGWGGGGGGGAGGARSTAGVTTTITNGGGGGGGALLQKYSLDVTPGVTYNVVIGQGGAGAPTANPYGADGGDTLFRQNATVLATFAGGQGGATSAERSNSSVVGFVTVGGAPVRGANRSNSSGASVVRSVYYHLTNRTGYVLNNVPSAGGLGTDVGTYTLVGADGNPSLQGFAGGLRGAPGVAALTYQGGGAGGGGGGGPGGPGSGGGNGLDGGNNSDPVIACAGGDASANSGAGGGGGGAAGGGSSGLYSSVGGNGGNGGSGQLTIMWVK